MLALAMLNARRYVADVMYGVVSVDAKGKSQKMLTEYEGTKLKAGGYQPCTPPRVFCPCKRPFFERPPLTKPVS